MTKRGLTHEQKRALCRDFQWSVNWTVFIFSRGKFHLHTRKELAKGFYVNLKIQADYKGGCPNITSVKFYHDHQLLFEGNPDQILLLGW